MWTDLGALLSWGSQDETVIGLGDGLLGGHLADSQYLVCIQGDLQDLDFLDFGARGRLATCCCRLGHCEDQVTTCIAMPGLKWLSLAG